MSHSTFSEESVFRKSILLTRFQANLPGSVQIDVSLGVSGLNCEPAIFDHIKAFVLEASLEYCQKRFLTIDPFQMERR